MCMFAYERPRCYIKASTISRIVKTRINLKITHSATQSGPSISIIMNTSTTEIPIRDWDGVDTKMRLILTLFVVTGLVSNSLVLILFRRLKRLRTWDNAFNINMTVSNLLSSVACTAILFTPEFATARIVSCHSFLVMHTCNSVNFVSLVEIAVLRYWRVCRPSHGISKSTFLMGLVIPWSTGLSIVAASLIRAPTNDITSCIESVILFVHVNHLSRLIFIPLLLTVGSVVMTICYVQIMMFFKHRCLSHVQNMTAIQHGTSVSSTSGRQFVHRMQEFYQGQIEEDKRVVMNSVLVVVAFYIIHIPKIMLLCGYLSGILKHIIPTFDYMLLFQTAGLAVNPVLYSMRSEYFRQGLKQLFRGKPNSVASEMAVEVSTHMWVYHA